MDYRQLPSHLVNSLNDYVSFGQIPGDFLRAIICNDLHKAVARADDYNKMILHIWVSYLYNHAPMGSWGSETSFNEWIAKGGIEGINNY